MHLNLARRNPIVVHIFTIATAFLSSLSLLLWVVAFLWLFVWLFINLMMREQTLIPGFTARFCFEKLTLGTMPIVTRRSRASTFHGMVIEEWTHGHFCLGYFSSSTHFDLVTGMAQRVWRHCGLVFVHDRYSHAGNCIGLLSNTGLFLSTGKKYLFLLQRHSSLSILGDCPCFISPTSGVKVS